MKYQVKRDTIVIKERVVLVLNNYEENFDMVYDSEDEALHSLDALVELLGDDIEREENAPVMLNTQCFERMRRVEAGLKYVLKSQPVQISHKLHEPFKSMGSISVEGTDISFCNTHMFVKIAQLASNVEVYPLTNGTVRLTFTFHGLTTSLDKEDAE